MMLVDISGARLALDMEDAASEILGYTNSLFYDDTAAVALRQQYNKINTNNSKNDGYTNKILFVNVILKTKYLKYIYKYIYECI